MKVHRLLLLTALLAAFFSGCNQSSTTEGILETDIRTSTLSRDLSPDTNTTELQTLAGSNNIFAFEMMVQLRESNEGNLFFSPYSISEAMVMAYAGAANETKTQMQNVLHFDANDTRLHASFNALDLHLNQTDANYTFAVANAIWPQKDFTILNSYLDTLMVHYGASLYMMDYVNQTEASRQTINTWVEEKTHNRIQELIKKGDITDLTRVVLTNAVYFKAKWADEFSENATIEDTFTLSNSTTVTTSMMQKTANFNYYEDDSIQLIKLPYLQNHTSMILMLPKEGMFENVEQHLASHYVHVADLSSTYVSLKLPKFEFTTPNYNLIGSFSSLGLTEPFDGYNTDFSGITGEKNLYISKILHKAFIKVDENGSEAAAATAIIGGITSVIPLEPPTPTPMFLNRPFFFFITDDLSGQILFAGVIENPTS